MKLVTRTFILLLITACASSSSLLEVVGLERVSITQDDYKRPDFFLTKKKQSFTNRSPANLFKASEGMVEELSNRQLYFLSFYRQYQKMSSILQIKPNVNSCPSFHNLLVQRDDLTQVDIRNYSTKVNFMMVRTDPKFAGVNPVLAIPYNDKIDLYTVLNKNNWSNSEALTVKALKNYYQGIEVELASLCDKGISPGYYVYENLVTYFKSSKDLHQTRTGLKALLKIPVLANMMILDNLNQAHVGSDKLYDYLLLKRTNAVWFGHYLDNVNAQRAAVLSKFTIRK